MTAKQVKVYNTIILGVAAEHGVGDGDDVCCNEKAEIRCMNVIVIGSNIEAAGRRDI